MIKDRQGHIVKELEGQNKLLKKLYSTSAGRCALKILVSPFVTHLGGLYMSSPFSKTSISSFIKNNDIDMSQYEEKKYKSYNDFFTRRIKDGQRPFDDSKDVLMAPADSKLTYYPINDDMILEIKDTKYQLKDLLQDQQLANEYDGGVCLVFRLAVDDYHRYSYVDDGQIVGHKKIKGIFHTVNPIANDICPIYKMNSREYCLVKNEKLGTVLMMEVGALMVGKIRNYKKERCQVKRGEEKGRFEFGGSTIIVMTEPGKVIPDQDLRTNTREHAETLVKMGEHIGAQIEQ